MYIYIAYMRDGTLTIWTITIKPLRISINTNNNILQNYYIVYLIYVTINYIYIYTIVSQYIYLTSIDTQIYVYIGNVCRWKRIII